MTKRTLALIANDYGDHVATRPDGCWVVYASNDTTEYFACSDFVVSSVVGPVLWMVPRLNPFNPLAD